MDQVLPSNSIILGQTKNVVLVGDTQEQLFTTCNSNGEHCAAPLHLLQCKLRSTSDGTLIRITCLIKIKPWLIRLRYTLPTRGKYHLHIRVGGQDIKGSPIRITAVDILGKSHLREPQGLCVTRDGLVVASDYRNREVYIFSLSGEILHTFEGFGNPHGVTEDGKGNILVVDCHSHQIKKWSKDWRQLLAQVGSRGSEDLQFRHPTGITCNPINDRIYVTDFDNHRIQVLNPDLTFHSTFGEYGSGPGQFIRPSAIASDKRGNVYVTDYGNRRVRAFTADGVSIRTWEECTVELHRADGIAVLSTTGVWYTSAKLVATASLRLTPRGGS